MMVATKLITIRPTARLAIRTSVAGVLTVMLSVLYLADTLHSGWVPHDTGQLGQTAERVLDGEMQHRDFDEPYTGGLGYLHAMAFRLLGVRAESMRWMLLCYFGLFVSAVYFIAIRVTSAWVAVPVTLLCAALSVPLYSAGLPSWYNLFFATFGLLALLQHLDTGKRRWLFWSGCCAGCSLLMKITGLYFVAVGLLYIAYQSSVAGVRGSGRSRVYAIVITVACVLFAGLGALFTRGSNPLANAAHFTLPLIGISACLVFQVWSAGRTAPAARIRDLARLMLPYCLGVAWILGLFVLPYAMTGGLEDLYRGLFVLPAARLAHAALAPPDLKWMVLSLPVLGILLAGLFKPARSLNRPVVLWAFAVLLTGVLFASQSPGGYLCLFQAMRNLIPLVVLAGVCLLVSRRAVEDRTALFLVMAAAALCSLVQYPYAYGTYFFYAAPLMILAVLYLVTCQPYAPKALFAALLVFALIAAVVRIPQPDPRLLNGLQMPAFPTATMNLARCHFHVYREDARVYTELVELIQKLTPEGGYIYAAPDCPEVYFLSGRRNPTRTFYELFQESDGDRRQSLLDMLQRRQINVVVINHHPPFSEALAEGTLGALSVLYPHQQVFLGSRRPDAPPTKLFTVFWR